MASLRLCDTFRFLDYWWKAFLLLGECIYGICRVPDNLTKVRVMTKKTTGKMEKPKEKEKGGLNFFGNCFCQHLLVWRKVRQLTLWMTPWTKEDSCHRCLTFIKIGDSWTALSMDGTLQKASLLFWINSLRPFHIAIFCNFDYVSGVSGIQMSGQIKTSRRIQATFKTKQSL